MSLFLVVMAARPSPRQPPCFTVCKVIWVMDNDLMINFDNKRRFLLIFI